MTDSEISSDSVHGEERERKKEIKEEEEEVLHLGENAFNKLQRTEEKGKLLKEVFRRFFNACLFFFFFLFLLPTLIFR